MIYFLCVIFFILIIFMIFYYRELYNIKSPKKHKIFFIGKEKRQKLENMNTVQFNKLKKKYLLLIILNISFMGGLLYSYYINVKKLTDCILIISAFGNFLFSKAIKY